jgi:chromosome segregation ATPase
MVESEMKEFFQRVIDSVAELSTQANRVEGLVEQVQRLTERLNDLEQRNHDLAAQISDANSTVARMETEIVSTRNQLDNEKAVTQALRQTIVERDSGVQSLEQSFRNEQDAHKLTTGERDDARTKISELERELQDTHNSLNELYVNRDEWRAKALESEGQNVSLKQQLDKINSVLNPLRIISGDVQSA